MTDANYQELYDRYWARPDRKRQEAYDEDVQDIVDNILALCSSSKVLDVGCGMGKLVRTLLDNGIEAYGLDVSQIAVDMGNTWAPGRFTFGNLTAGLPFADSEFDTVVCKDVLEYIHEDHVPSALAELRRITSNHIFITLSTSKTSDGNSYRTMRDHTWWQDQLLRAGMRLHPLSSMLFSKTAWRTETWRATFLMEIIPDKELVRDPLANLREERDLHMDMTREVGVRSQAHIERYNVAASIIREGDVVLDAACGLGYGSYLLHAVGRARKVVGIDLSRESIEYAKRQFVSDNQEVRFEVVDLGDRLPYEDNSFDVVASFETLEHLHDPEFFLDEVNRILRPGGRVIVSVPNDWTDETGNDPNPYHFHVYDWKKIREQISNRFNVDAAFAQVAGGGMKLTNHSPSLTRIQAYDSQSIEAEWWLLVGAKSPLKSEGVNYCEHSFGTSSDVDLPTIIDFSKHYENPWLVKALIVIGWRFNDPSELQKLAQSVICQYNPDSPDYGGALCVISYGYLYSLTDISEIEDILHKIDAYLSLTESSTNPHIQRWRISLLYVAGRLNGAAGRFREAKEYYQSCISFSTKLPFATLATKTCDSFRRLGMMALVQGDGDEALYFFSSGIEHSLSALQSIDGRDTFGYPSHHLQFGFKEMSEVLDIASRCSELRHEILKRGISTKWYGFPDFRDRLSNPATSEFIEELRTLRNNASQCNLFVHKHTETRLLHKKKENRGPIRRALSRWAKSLRKRAKALQ
ncbi:class I SAM-dependent methyltransferase [Roseinatronobacter sp.]